MKMNGLYSALQHSHAVAAPNKSAATQSVRNEKVLHMVKSERMGGTIPVWKSKPASEIKDTTTGFETALTSALNGDDANLNALSITPEPEVTQDGKPFSFGDLVDMANPLHHIPVVNYAYRGITGDQIRPISQIVGGALYGGPLGAASGVANAVIQEETGKDIGENAIAMVFKNDTPEAVEFNDQPQEENLPTSLLAFTSAPEQRTSKPTIYRASQEQLYPDIDDIPTYREPITELLLNTKL